MQTPRVPSEIQHWSTRDVPASQRLDHYAEALTAAVDPMRVSSGQRPAFAAEVRAAELGPINVIRASGSAHRCVRSDEDIALSEESNFHLIVNTSAPWRLTRLRRLDLRPGDAVLLDSRIEHDIELGDFDITHLRLPDAWLRQWLPSPGVVAGRVIQHDASWGRALAAFASRLTPAFAVASPLPGHTIPEQVAMLLALTAHEIAGVQRQPAVQERALRDRIQDCIAERSTEPALTASQAALAVQVSTRSLHRCLAGYGTSFGQLLIAARVQHALQMLQASNFARLIVAEIGRRAGFPDPSHFTRVMLMRCGQTPVRYVESGD